MTTRRAAPPFTALWTALALLLLGGQALAAAVTHPAGTGAAVRAGDTGPATATLDHAGLLADAVALAAYAPAAPALERERNGRSGGGAPNGHPRPHRLGGAAAPSASVRFHAARPDGDARRALERAGRASAPSTAPPFPSF